LQTCTDSLSETQLGKEPTLKIMGFKNRLANILCLKNPRMIFAPVITGLLQ